jgi:glutamate racemase
LLRGATHAQARFMIGVFDSGLGGLTILRALVERFPRTCFQYLGDHANVPYGNRSSDEVVELTRAGVEWLFRRNCRLVLLGCNTATAVALRTLQQQWLPGSGYDGYNVLGIVAPTVEAATQTPWAVSTPQYPQKYNTDLIAVFGTTRTITSGVFPQEIRKRCPKVRVVQQICAELAGAIEDERPEPELDVLVAMSVAQVLEESGGEPPVKAILGCTHFPLVEHLFRRHLPPSTRLLGQPQVVADSLEDYLARRPQFLAAPASSAVQLQLLTTGDPERVSRLAQVFWPSSSIFQCAEGYAPPTPVASNL